MISILELSTIQKLQEKLYFFKAFVCVWKIASVSPCVFQNYISVFWKLWVFLFLRFKFVRIRFEICFLRLKFVSHKVGNFQSKNFLSNFLKQFECKVFINFFIKLVLYFIWCHVFFLLVSTCFFGYHVISMEYHRFCRWLISVRQPGWPPLVLVSTLVFGLVNCFVKYGLEVACFCWRVVW